jgi:tetratricopeptide (TPR) repeat protein
VVHSYLIDTLPCALLTATGGRWLRLHVRARIDDVEAARLSTSEDLSQLAELAGREDACARLLPLYELLRLEKAFFPVELGELPYGDEVASFVAEAERSLPPQAGAGRYVIHPHHAIQALEAMLGILRPDGFVLFHDYGPAHLDEAIQAHSHQRYGGSRSMGINFPLLDHVLGRRSVRVVAPQGDAGSTLHARLVCREPQPVTEAAFLEAFDAAVFTQHEALVQRARAARDAGDMETAQGAYLEAHRAAPENWHLLVEWSAFATFGLKDVTLGVDLGSRAVTANPTTSPLAWNQYGDALYQAGRLDQARDAYLTALAILPEDPRAHLNLAWIHLDQARFREAVGELSLGLAHDVHGTYRPTLLAKLGETLDRWDAFRRRKQRDGNP